MVDKKIDQNIWKQQIGNIGDSLEKKLVLLCLPFEKKKKRMQTSGFPKEKSVKFVNRTLLHSQKLKQKNSPRGLMA